MGKSSIVILSGACCNPSMKDVDMQLERILDTAAKQMGEECIVKKVSIASVAFSGLDKSFGDKLGSEMRSLLQKRGMGVLPIVLLNGEIAFYGYVPTLEKACQLLQSSTS